MGCCLSTQEKRPKHDHPHFPCISKSPPRPEEETVKEVLSETPKARPNPGPISIVGPDPNPDPEPEMVRILKPTKPNTVVSRKHLPIDPIKPKSPGSGRVPKPVKEVSDVSEMCSLMSDSISNSALREDDGSEVVQRVVNYKKQKPRGQNGNFTRAGVSPGRVPEPAEVSSDVSEICSLSGSISTSTLREDDGSEVVQRVVHYRHKSKPQGQNGNFTRSGVSPGRARSGPSPTQGRNPGPGRVRQVEGQRRSRSPATRSNTNNVGRSQSGRRTGTSPGRVRMVSGPDRGNEVKEVEVNQRERGAKENENEWDGPNESLENPLVSLECFIFL